MKSPDRPHHEESEEDGQHNVKEAVEIGASTKESIAGNDQKQAQSDSQRISVQTGRTDSWQIQVSVAIT